MVPHPREGQDLEKTCKERILMNQAAGPGIMQWHGERREQRVFIQSRSEMSGVCAGYVLVKRFHDVGISQKESFKVRS
jgi:hypothetical protein